MTVYVQLAGRLTRCRLPGPVSDTLWLKYRQMKGKVWNGAVTTDYSFNHFKYIYINAIALLQL